MERLTYKDCSYCELVNCQSDSCKRDILCLGYKVYEKLKHYEDLEEQYGLPKFHIGQLLYSINFMNEIEEERVSMITQKVDRSFKYRLSSSGSVWEATEEEVGRLLFLTREEAEAKLKELESE